MKYHILWQRHAHVTGESCVKTDSKIITGYMFIRNLELMVLLTSTKTFKFFYLLTKQN